MSTNKTACVTGTDRGIGLAITKSLLQEGYTVYAGVSWKPTLKWTCWLSNFLINCTHLFWMWDSWRRFQDYEYGGLQQFHGIGLEPIFTLHILYGLLEPRSITGTNFSYNSICGRWRRLACHP